jgi:porphobilinogen synthase
MFERPRRNRISPAIRDMVAEVRLTPAKLVLPLFVHDQDLDVPIPSMPHCQRRGLTGTVRMAREAFELGIRAVALFPYIPHTQKDAQASEALNPEGLIPRAVRALKRELPELAVITDVAMDPYSIYGHDGVVANGGIDNDATLPILAAMAVVQARAGADVVAPSDMMDGRVAAIRNALDASGYQQVLICSYCAKYASSFYGPFRDALESAPRAHQGVPSDKRSYQMDPANAREALREAALDEREGADWLMVKPGLPYLDIISQLHRASALPIAAYHVSGEYAMLRAASERGWLDYQQCLLESLLSLRRAGAEIIFTYGACDAARALRGH